MHVLLKRILIRGPIVFAILFGLGWVLRGALITFMSSGPVELNTDGSLAGPIGYGLFGVLVLCLLEWVSYARERWTNRPPKA
jgi:hypothetical protein